MKTTSSFVLNSKAILDATEAMSARFCPSFPASPGRITGKVGNGALEVLARAAKFSARPHKLNQFVEDPWPLPLDIWSAIPAV